MRSFKFIGLDEVFEMHDALIERIGGIPGVRDNNLLESAILQPQTMMFGQYVYEDIFQMGSAYCFHIIKNHPFVDGNKRMGILVALFFFERNEILIDADHDELYLLAMHTASSKINKDEIAHFFKETATFSKKLKKQP